MAFLWFSLCRTAFPSCLWNRWHSPAQAWSGNSQSPLPTGSGFYLYDTKEKPTLLIGWHGSNYYPRQYLLCKTYTIEKRIMDQTQQQLCLWVLWIHNPISWKGCSPKRWLPLNTTGHLAKHSPSVLSSTQPLICFLESSQACMKSVCSRPAW